MKEKEQVLILSYYFPPCNLTPSERIYSWAKYLKNGDYYPIIITRNWDTKINNSTTDAYKSSGEEVKIEKFEHYEVHYLPYKASFKDQLFIRLEGTKFYFIYLIVAFLYLLFQLVFVKYSNYGFFYHYICQYLNQQPRITKMVVSASPYELFGIAYWVQKKCQIKWIADYRDDWSTRDFYKDSFSKKIINIFNRYYEKKWVASSQAIISVSAYLVQRIANLTGKKGYLMHNGYMPENYTQHYQPFDDFTISYTGSVYASQPIEFFLDGVKKFIENKKRTCRLKVVFIGIKNEIFILNRILNNIKGYEAYFEFTTRIPKDEAIAIQAKSHLLLACSYGDFKGIPGSKLYEYIALKKTVIVYPTDHDVIEETLLETGQGLICNHENEFLDYLNQYYTLYEQNTSANPTQFNEEAIRNYSREAQTNELIQVLNTL